MVVALVVVVVKTTTMMMSEATHLMLKDEQSNWKEVPICAFSDQDAPPEVATKPPIHPHKGTVRRMLASFEGSNKLWKMSPEWSGPFSDSTTTRVRHRTYGLDD